MFIKFIKNHALKKIFISSPDNFMYTGVDAYKYLATVFFFHF